MEIVGLIVGVMNIFGSSVVIVGGPSPSMGTKKVCVEVELKSPSPSNKWSGGIASARTTAY